MRINFFPERALDSSIHTSILLGISLSWFFTETLGWTFGGFVVPGYLAATAIVQPMGLLATVVESILTYGAVWLVAKAAAHLDLWTSAFGRERFLLFVVFSVPVRLFAETVAAPHVQQIMSEWFQDPQLVYTPFLSIGIIMVPLLSNALWWPGMSRGLLQVGIVSGTTYLLLVYVLTPYTNLNLGHLELVFDHLALEFTSVPKAHIILLTSAVIAARNNLLYGWDFNGIMVPSLLAVILDMPEKFGVTFVEIIVLTLVYRRIIRLPGLSSLNLEGPRRLVTMYLLSFVLKWALSTAAEYWQLDLYVSDIFGFGYLLTSLVAVKCVIKQTTFKIIAPVAFTAVQGFIWGSLVAFLLVAGNAFFKGHTAEPTIAQRPAQSRSLEQSILLGRASIRRIPIESFHGNYGRGEALVDGLHRLVTDGDVAVQAVMNRWQKRSFLVERVRRHDGRFCIGAREQRLTMDEPTGLPAIWWCGGDGPVLLVPKPLSDPVSLVTAAWFAEHGPFSAVVLVGVDPWLVEQKAGERARQIAGLTRTLRSRVEKLPIVVLTGATDDQSTFDPVSSHSREALLSIQQLLPHVVVRYEQRGSVSNSLWHVLGRQDGVLSVAEQSLANMLKRRGDIEVPREIPPFQEYCAERVEVLTKPNYASLAHQLGFAELVVGSTLDHAAHWGANTVMPVLSYVARQHGADLVVTHDRHNRPIWVVRVADKGDFLAIRPNAGGDLVVGATRDSGRREVALAVCELFGQLDGPAFWAGLDSRESAFTIREVVRPRLEPRWQRPRWLALMHENWNPTADPALLGLDRDTVLPAEIETIFDPLRPLRNIWPSLRIATEESALALVARTDPALGYVNALLPDRGVALWLIPELLEEVTGHPFKKARLEQYERMHIPVVYREAQVDAAEGGDEPQFVRRPEVEDLMAAHMRTSAMPPLERLLDKNLKIEVIDSGMRLHLSVRTDEWRCIAGLSERPEVAGGVQCWLTNPTQ